MSLTNADVSPPLTKSEMNVETDPDAQARWISTLAECMMI